MTIFFQKITTFVNISPVLSNKNHIQYTHYQRLSYRFRRSVILMMIFPIEHLQFSFCQFPAMVKQV